MRRIVTAITAAALAFSMVSLAMPANAAGGFDSAYAGESAFLTLNPGQGGTFTVFFANTGTNSWTKGTATQVDLAACLEDKVTCNQQDAADAPYNPGGATGWLSATRYTSHTQTTVAPGAIGTFSYNVLVPSNGTGLHRFNGATVVSATGADVHNEGYYQDVNTPGQQATCTPTAITTTPTNAQETVGSTHTQSATVTCSDGKGSGNAAVTFAIQTPVNSLNSNLTLTGVTDSTGKISVTWSRSNPDTDSVDVFPTAQPNIRATATIFWVTKPVITCTPTTSATSLNNQGRIFTVTVRKPDTGDLVSSGVVVSVGLQTAVTRGTATISTSTSGAVAADQTTNTNAVALIQLAHQATDANGNITFTVSGANSTVTPLVWIEDKTTFGGDGEDTTKDAGVTGAPKADNFEFQAVCGTTTFSPVNVATLTVSPSTAATIAQGAQRIFTVTAVDSAGNPTATKVNVGFAENLLSTLGTNAKVIWYDIDTAVADQRGSAASSSVSSRQSVCNRVPGGTWINTLVARHTSIPADVAPAASTGPTGMQFTGVYNAASGLAEINAMPNAKNPAIPGTITVPDPNATGDLVTDGSATNTGDPATDTTTGPNARFDGSAAYDSIATFTLPAIGRASFAVCSDSANDTFTPIAWQDLEATPNRTPQTGEPQAQGGATTTAAQVLTSGTTYGFNNSATAEVNPACNSGGETGKVCATSSSSLGRETFRFRMRNQNRNGFYSDSDQTVQWTVQNTGSSSVFLVSADGSPVGLTCATVSASGSGSGGCATITPGNSLTFTATLAKSDTNCSRGGSSENNGTTSFGEYGQTNCHNRRQIGVNSDDAGSATITATLVSNGAATGSATKTWVKALAEPTEPAGVSFTVSGTVIGLNENATSGARDTVSSAGSFYLLQTSTGSVYEIKLGGHSSETFIYLGTQLATDSDGSTAYAQFVGLYLGTGVKLTYSNTPVSTGTNISSPTSGNAVHNITATQ